MQSEQGTERSPSPRIPGVPRPRYPAHPAPVSAGASGGGGGWEVVVMGVDGCGAAAVSTAVSLPQCGLDGIWR